MNSITCQNEILIKYKPKNWFSIFNKFLNIANPKGTLVLGISGSGKTSVFINESIKQSIQNGFGMVLHSTVPNSTNLAYTYFVKNKKAYSKYRNAGRFATINLDAPKYSDRCNPIQSSLIETKEEALDIVKSIFINADKNYLKNLDFFQMSAISITSAALWFLKNYKEGVYCTLPHLIEFLKQPDYVISTILDNYCELDDFTYMFSDAFKKEAWEQLNAQFSTARMALNVYDTDVVFWVMTDPDNTGVNLKVNLSDEVTVLNIINNSQNYVTNEAAVGLYVSQAAKLIKTPSNVPCSFIVDELDRVYIYKLDNFISNKNNSNVFPLFTSYNFDFLKYKYGNYIVNSLNFYVRNVIKITKELRISIDYKSEKENIKGNIILSSKDTVQLISFPKVYPDLTPNILNENRLSIKNDIAEIICKEEERILEEKSNTSNSSLCADLDECEIDNDINDFLP